MGATMSGGAHRNHITPASDTRYPRMSQSRKCVDFGFAWLDHDAVQKILSSVPSPLAFSTCKSFRLLLPHEAHLAHTQLENHSKHDRMVVAANHDNLFALTWMLAKGHLADPRAAERAAERGNLAIIKLLSAYGCPIRTSFLPAARGGQTEVLAWIAGRVTKGLQWDDGVSEAARRGHLDALKFLLASGHGSRANEEWIQFLACKGGHLPILQWFFAKGIPFGDTVVFVAATRGDLAILEWLRSCGLQFSTGDFECALRSATKRGRVDTLMWIRELAPQVFFRHRDSIAVKALQLAQMVPTREIQQTLDFLESMGAPLHGERLKKIITRICKLKRFGEKPSKHVSRDWSQT